MTRILGLETSCDETAAAVVVDGAHVLSNVVASQVQQHARYGGVIPELAAREHLKAVRPIVETALAEARVAPAELDGIAVTCSPGLLPALLVGIAFAKGLAATLGKPLVGVHHLLAHVYGAFLEAPARLADPAAYPLLALIVSGGHTLIIEVGCDGACQVLGQTLDDAAGEAFDKAARVLHLPYPGGPVIDRLARQGNPAACEFPRGLTGTPGTPVRPEHRLQFSFSGVKTALLYHLRGPGAAAPAPSDAPLALSESALCDVVASYQEAVVDALVTKLRWAAADRQARTLVVCGGVACNSRLRAKLGELAGRLAVPLLIAPPKYCTDNAAMIAGLGYHHWRRGEYAGMDLDARPRSALPARVPFTPGSP